MLGEFDYAELRRTWNAFIATSVIQNQQPDVRIIRGNLFSTLGNNDLDTAVLKASLQKYVLHDPVRRDALTIDDRIARPKFRKSTGFNAAKVCFTTCLRADSINSREHPGPDIYGQPGYYQR